MTSPAEQLLSLNEEESVELYNRLLLFATKRYVGLEGLSASDLVQEAIIDALKGSRRWPQSNPPTGKIDANLSLFQFLCSVLTSNVLLRIERGTSHAKLQRPYSDTEGLSIGEHNEMREEIRKAVADDQRLAKVIDLWAKDYGPKEIATETGLPIKQIYQMLKRFQKRLVTMREETING